VKIHIHAIKFQGLPLLKSEVMKRRITTLFEPTFLPLVSLIKSDAQRFFSANRRPRTKKENERYLFLEKGDKPTMWRPCNLDKPAATNRVHLFRLWLR
jgi:hypothetical protein